jgi:hypothetical protein
MGLVHVSRGIDKERHLVVSKPGVKTEEEIPNKDSNQEPSKPPTEQDEVISRFLNL